MSASLVANIFLRGKIECLTGLHVGGSKEKFQIGGVDNPVLRDPEDKLPYIPGSSLKGKLRMLLEYHLGLIDVSGKPSTAKQITDLFGTAPDSSNSSGSSNGESGEETGNSPVVLSSPLRLVVRDAYPDKVTRDKWENMDSELLYTELKQENTIDRLTAEANPRSMERVVKGSCFDFEMILGVYRDDNGVDNWKAHLDNLVRAMRLLEHSALGGSGSRGYGKVRFRLMPAVVVTNTDYRDGGDVFRKLAEKIPDSVDELHSLSEAGIPGKAAEKKLEEAKENAVAP
ncbi:type III-A CRISPR-associated RAMP protein Csm3 [Prosthecochloris sp. N3]|uniref:CRISPR system Cms endoribonuclease Csm3 n=1 Tax=Prosthecochloris ethylica TaxID=2743976 RepID=A0ABR9XTQ5_9CHLB|nr:type III-A CRISPR-associated RAMP protein Csm3 [Prosthecochloris ethylica]MBF0586928.1 type III-A CRISPR-associated RAMP protein Csm3 [Prosthecochloris ethylica]MBF0637195.1 type III-A CRISPR-associated RAMP protein Csm3 [Prosthecochloris ethylica]NUK48203.1 type III-A CRISPR-associated RAMP protein Csm3 [Prosthecochloris ethylica]